MLQKSKLMRFQTNSCFHISFKLLITAIYYDLDVIKKLDAIFAMFRLYVKVLVSSLRKSYYIKKL